MTKIPKKYEHLTVDDATHIVHCRHCVTATQCEDYTMLCIVLDRRDGKHVRVLVFGDRYWKNKKHIRRIRYIQNWKLTKIKK